MYQDRHGHLRHDVTRPDEWGREMLGFLREHDLHFERLRHEYLCQLDEDYRAWRRRERDAASQHATPDTAAPDTAAPDDAAPATALSASPEPSGVAMPLPAAELDRSGRTIEPDAQAPARGAAVQRFHEEREQQRWRGP